MTVFKKCGVALLVGTIGLLAWRLLTGNDPAKNALKAREIAMWGLGRFLAEQKAVQVVVVSNPFAKTAAEQIALVEEAGIRGLEAGLERKVLVRYPELKPGAAQNPQGILNNRDTRTPLSYLVTVGAFDRLLKSHQRGQVIVSLIGIPAQFNTTKAWVDPGPTKFAFLFPDFRTLGESEDALEFMLSEKLAAVVVPHPEAVGDEVPVGRNKAIEFEKRFLLVTPQNVRGHLKRHPKLF